MIQKQHIRISWWKATGSLILAMSMLVYSGFSAVTTMECFMSGTKTVKVGVEDSCCKAESSPMAALNVKCCDIEKSELTFHNFKVEHEDFIPLPQLSYFVSFETYVEPFLSTKQFLVAQFAHAPPLSGRDILSQICKYSI